MVPLWSWIVLGSVAYCIALWYLVLWILAVSSGWRKLSRRFYVPAPLSAEPGQPTMARIGAVRYNGALKIAMESRGLFLAPYRIFRPFHPPLLIPWSEIQIGEATGRMFAGSVLRFAAVPGVWIAFPQHVLDILRTQIAERGTFDP